MQIKHDFEQFGGWWKGTLQICCKPIVGQLWDQIEKNVDLKHT